MECSGVWRVLRYGGYRDIPCTSTWSLMGYAVFFSIKWANVKEPFAAVGKFRLSIGLGRAMVNIREAT